MTKYMFSSQLMIWFPWQHEHNAYLIVDAFQWCPHIGQGNTFWNYTSQGSDRWNLSIVICNNWKIPSVRPLASVVLKSAAKSIPSHSNIFGVSHRTRRSITLDVSAALYILLCADKRSVFCVTSSSYVSLLFHASTFLMRLKRQTFDQMNYAFGSQPFISQYILGGLSICCMHGCLQSS